MRRKYTVFALICLFILLILVYRFYSEKINNAHLNREMNDNYTLINIDGSVRLYREETLIQIFDNVNPFSLPLQDQDNLRSGIKVKSINEALQLIEDFDG